MELCIGWLERALAVIQSEADVAVVSGQVIDFPTMPLCSTETNPEQPSNSVSTAEVSFVRGAGMYKRSVLQQVGTFNPYLYSDEEPELSLRIRQAGYRLLCLELPIAYHYSDPREAISTLIARRERNLYLGFGQNMRYHLGDKLFWPYLRERGYGCFPTLGLAAGGASLIVSAFTGRCLWFGVWCLASGLFVLLHAVRKCSVRGAIYSLIHRLLGSSHSPSRLRCGQGHTAESVFPIVRLKGGNMGQIAIMQLIGKVSGRCIGRIVQRRLLAFTRVNSAEYGQA
jgi:hypothetical protein